MMADATATTRKKRVRRKPAATRALLIEACRNELLAHDGDFEIGEIAERAGVSNGLYYHYFGSKGALLAAVVEDYYERLEQDSISLSMTEYPTWRARERERVDRFVRFVVSDPLSTIVMGRLANAPEVLAVATRRLNAIIDEGARNFAQGQRGGEVDDALPPEVLSAAVHGALRHVVLHALSNAAPIDANALSEHIWLLVDKWTRN